jgi:hypothetical protein
MLLVSVMEAKPHLGYGRKPIRLPPGQLSPATAGRRWKNQMGAAQVIVLLIAVVFVTCWGPVVRGLIVLASTAVIATLGFGLIVIWQIIHHMAR